MSEQEISRETILIVLKDISKYILNRMIMTSPIDEQGVLDIWGNISGNKIENLDEFLDMVAITLYNKIYESVTIFPSIEDITKAPMEVINRVFNSREPNKEEKED